MTERLWNDSKIPRHGWICIVMEDNEDNLETCQVCGVQEIRYVHIMHHPDCSHTVRAGSHCASKMELDSNTADIREHGFINKIKRKKNWLKDDWKISTKGNPRKVKEGYIITLFPKENQWTYSICKKGQGNRPIYSKKLYNDQEGSKEAAFEEFERMK